MSHHDKPCEGCKDCRCGEPAENEALKHLDKSLAEIEGRIKTAIGEVCDLDVPEPKRHLWTALEHIQAARRKAAAPQEGEKTL